MGNSQGVRIPKDVYEMFSLHVGAIADMKAEQAKNEVVLKFERPAEKYARNRKVSMGEFCSALNRAAVDVPFEKTEVLASQDFE